MILDRFNNHVRVIRPRQFQNNHRSKEEIGAFEVFVALHEEAVIFVGVRVELFFVEFGVGRGFKFGVDFFFVVVFFVGEILLLPELHFLSLFALGDHFFAFVLFFMVDFFFREGDFGWKVTQNFVLLSFSFIP